MGAESIALFARVGGGIYTKAADVGADIVGKVEAGIPEDDPRNPATIADNVGDNVGDVAGMGADLFGSYVATVLASMVLGNYVIADNAGFTDKFNGMGPILLPIMIAGVGIILSIIGTWFVKVDDKIMTTEAVQKALNTGNWVSLGLTGVVCYFLIQWMLPETMQMEFFGIGLQTISNDNVFYAVLCGLTVGAAISAITEYFTGMGKKPVMDIVQRSATGAGTNIIAGLGVGMMSTALPVILFAGTIWGSYEMAGFYGVAIAASAMMATTAMQLAIDAFGPIADNAGGIAEMSELPKEVRERTDILDTVGNTTAAIGKGFAGYWLLSTGYYSSAASTASAARPYSFSLLWSVFRLMPRISAARVLLFVVACSVLRISCFSASSTVVPTPRCTASGSCAAGRTLCPNPGGRCLVSTSPPSQTMTARSSVFRNSRTLPGQA